jgi:hypothetical protein
VTRWLLTVLAIAAVVLQGGPAAAASQDIPSGRPCGTVTLDYGPTTIHPGELMDMGLDVTNCASFAETLHLGVRTEAPCGFPHPTPFDYELGAHEGVGSSALVIGPNCLGRYRVRVALFYRGHMLDSDIAGFQVVEDSN